jgi:hypothetical protein
MKINSYGNDTTFKGTERYIEVQPNAVGVLVGLDTYTKICTKAIYDGDMTLMVPDFSVRDDITTADVHDPMGITIAHTLTFTNGIKVTQDMVDNPTDYALVMYNKQAVVDAQTKGEYAELANPKYCAVLDIDDPATSFTTVGATINTLKTTGATEYIANMTACILLCNNGYIEVAQIQDFSYDESTDEIDTTNKHSNGYKSSLDGLSSSSITNVSGIYAPILPSIKTIESAFNGKYTVTVRHGGIRAKHAEYNMGLYKVSNFTLSGAMSGSDALTYSADFTLQSGTNAKKTIV